MTKDVALYVDLRRPSSASPALNAPARSPLRARRAASATATRSATGSSTPSATSPAACACTTRRTEDVSSEDRPTAEPRRPPRTSPAPRPSPARCGATRCCPPPTAPRSTPCLHPGRPHLLAPPRPTARSCRCTAGRGLVCTARRARRSGSGAGDTVWVPPGERHWHGAYPGHAHDAHSRSRSASTEWLDEVTAEEYAGLHREEGHRMTSDGTHARRYERGLADPARRCSARRTSTGRWPR